MVDAVRNSAGAAATGTDDVLPILFRSSWNRQPTSRSLGLSGRVERAMLRISKLSDYGTIMLAYMAEQPKKLHSAAELAEALELGPATVSKILKALAKSSLLSAFRGANGGYALARAPEEITLAEVIDALEEQPFGLTECSSHEGNCAQEVSCVMRANWMRINDIVRQALEGVTLADMIRPPTPRSGITGHLKGVPVAVRG
jgi:FeS assembly SUF system regulator